MGKFKEFLKTYRLNESIDVTEDDFVDNGYKNSKERKEKERIYAIIDSNKDIQKMIDDENEDMDSIDESVISEGKSLPFGFDGTFYNGDEKVDMGDSLEMQSLFESEYLENDEQKKQVKLTDTFKFLQRIKQNPPSLKELRENLQTFKIEEGKLKRRGDKFYGNYVDMSNEDIQELIKKVNEKRTIKTKIYNIDNNGRISKKIIIGNEGSENEQVVVPEKPIKSPASMKRLCNIINSLYSKIMPDMLFWYDNFGSSKDKIMTISSKKVEKNKTNDKIHDFRDVKYEPLTDEKIRMDVCDKLNTAMNRKSSKIRSQMGYQNGRFTIDGQPMTDQQLKSFIRDRNGMPDKDDDKYWNKFNFLAEGGKIGKTIGSFSLPPGASCMSNVQCAHEGCYAYPSFKYPTVRACWMSNMAKLQEGTGSDGTNRFKQFEKECVDFIKKHNLTHFRFHVSGDIDIGPNKEKYIQSICNIAMNLGGVSFWTYTKDYKAWGSATIPSNLVVLFSAWGPMKPDDSMVKKHPVAFLYDKGNEEIMKYMRGIDPVHFDEYEAHDRKAPVVFCPCSDPSIKENVTCDRCGICFTRKEVSSDGQTRIVGNVAFHKH